MLFVFQFTLLFGCEFIDIYIHINKDMLTCSCGHGQHYYSTLLGRSLMAQPGDRDAQYSFIDMLDYNYTAEFGIYVGSQIALWGLLQQTNLLCFNINRYVSDTDNLIANCQSKRAKRLSLRISLNTDHASQRCTIYSIQY